MASLTEHQYDCRRILGREWTDALFAEHGEAHRCHRHHIEGIEEVRQQWGDEAAIAAKIHILIDCWGIPSKSDYERGFVDQFGYAEGTTWSEVKRMLKTLPV